MRSHASMLSIEEVPKLELSPGEQLRLLPLPLPVGRATLGPLGDLWGLPTAYKGPSMGPSRTPYSGPGRALYNPMGPL